MSPMNARFGQGSGFKMLMKIATLMLILVAALSIFGGVRLKKRKQGGRGASCKSCGRPLIGKGPCACGHNPTRKA